MIGLGAPTPDRKEVPPATQARTWRKGIRARLSIGWPVRRQRIAGLRVRIPPSAPCHPTCSSWRMATILAVGRAEVE